ncbi:DUF4440 domain-containing protein [Parvularcula flava]|uniref:DUF4440 domain-containing protein n=1 Tax=Aquisalinus luteolus TaxID=1566827 RepID=A0A8J3A743_9PROT|nr:DUF2231 domain-containing protein [Aquisalinus luteolus]NHK29688.1 DUF4440 domain-containing protein [Aquisalinus luteolus]GGI02103.1 hypothetical protein GCM10011355_34310 [Aquisalinus luteolus]
MTNLIEPNIHPILVHFSYALTVTAAISYLLSLVVPERLQRTLRPAADWMLAFAALAVVATIAAGFQAYYSVAHDGPSHEAMTTHRNWAVPTGIVILLLAGWRWMGRKAAASTLFTGAVFVAAVLVSITAWWGGTIVYKHGLGVQRLPEVTGDGHDHDHGDAVSGSNQDHEDEAHGDDHHEESSHGEDDHHADEADKTVSAAPAGSPESAVEAFSAALKAGDEQMVKALLLPDVIIAEGGGTERSFEEYAGHHMPADMAFTSAVETTLKDRQSIVSGDMATIISQSQLHGNVDGKTIHSSMMETMVLSKTDEGWRIAHIHWSSAPITGEHEH